MSAKAAHALLTLLLGVAFGATWLRLFWNDARRASPALLLAPAIVGIVGLGPWVAYDFSLSHWAGAFSLAQALFNALVVALVLMRQRTRGTAPS